MMGHKLMLPFDAVGGCSDVTVVNQSSSAVDGSLVQHSGHPGIVVGVGRSPSHYALFVFPRHTTCFGLKKKKKKEKKESFYYSFVKMMDCGTCSMVRMDD